MGWSDLTSEQRRAALAAEVRRVRTDLLESVTSRLLSLAEGRTARGVSAKPEFAGQWQTSAATTPLAIRL